MATRRIAEARLRMKNQLTLPEPIADALDAAPDDTIVFETDPEQPEMAVIRRVPRTFAGAMPGMYGTTEDVKAYLRAEHESWGD